MNSMSYSKLATFLALGIVATLFILSTVVAQEAPEETAEMESEESMESMEGEIVELEGVVTIGTRAKRRSAIDSAVPIDVIGGDEFIKQGVTDLQDLLRNIVPSYNVNTQPISDAGTVVRPANLRGLAPDHTLVLVNNKRRHRAAVIHWLGNGLADGAQGPDLSAIPAIALKQVEVLRDGASAQYGSDAIAGVMNFQLKDNHEGGTIEFKPGIYQDGDGRQFAVAGNIGLGDEDAWTSLSLEYGGADPTIRSVQRGDANNLVGAGNLNVRDPAQIWGSPIVEGDTKFFANYGSTLTDSVDFYGHANYARKRVEGGFYFRNPNTRSGVFSTDGGTTLLVGDLTGAEYPNIPITNHVPDQDELAKVFRDPNLFTFQEMFPGGFTPRFGAETIDSSVLAGIKGGALGDALGSPLDWDLSAYFGRHHADFFIFNTVNASLGPDTPTEFDPGDYIQTDYNLNFDVTHSLTDMIFLASGLEYRNEGFEVVEGQRESYQIGPLAGQGFSAASNGFSGFSQIAAGTWNRTNVAAYLESELRPLQHLLVGLAVRGEDFEDFGSTVNYKVATNIGIKDFLSDAGMISNDEMDLKFRGSYSTGFRAPTPGQQNTFNVTTEFNFEKNDLVNNGTIPSTNRAAALVGGKALEPETSKNFTGGIAFTVRNISLTVDIFDIRMKDRLALSQDFELTAEQKDELLKAGVTSAANLQEFRFFTNDFDTTTQGVDMVLTVPIPNGNLTGIFNQTATTVTDFNPVTLDELRIKELEENLPKQRGSLTATQSVTDRLSALGRVSFFGDWFDSEDNETYTGKVLFDLEATYTGSSGLTLTVGVQNLFNTYPDENPGAVWRDAAQTDTGIGNTYGQFSPFGFNGAYWYSKVGYRF